jgi:hypothetical protein
MVFYANDKPIIGFFTSPFDPKLHGTGDVSGLMGLKPTYNPTGLQWGCIEFCPHNNRDTYLPDSISANSLVSLY